MIAKAPEGYLARVADALETLEPWDAEAIKARLDELGEGGRPQPDEGVPAGPSGGDRVDGVAAAAGVARAARPRAHRRAPPARSREARASPAARARSCVSFRTPRPRSPRRTARRRATIRPEIDVAEDPVRRAAQAADGRVLAAPLRRAHVAADGPAGDRRALHGRHLVRLARGTTSPANGVAPRREARACARTS